VRAIELDGLGEPAELVHDGRRSRRWRFRARALRRQPRLAQSLGGRLRALPGVEHVEIDARSGSILMLTREARLPSALRPHEAPARPSSRERRRSIFGRGEAAPRGAWHSLSVAEASGRLSSSPDGLSRAEAERRLRHFGSNALEPERVRSRLRIVAEQLGNVPTAILIASSLISSTLGEWLDAGAILTVVGINSAIGYTVERANERLIASWHKAEAGELRALRDGELCTLSTALLVPGDVVWLRAGDVVPADARVLEAHRLSLDEAALTGESEPQEKSPTALPESTPLADRASMLYSGTTVVAGRGRALVVATGAETELARVRRLIDQSVAPEAPLARRLTQLANRVGRAAIAGAVVSASASLLHRRPLGDVLRGAVALGVAALPEGLPVVSTAALVRSMARMRKEGMVVRRLSSAETLGGVTVICTDKTGTLTMNRMQVVAVDLGDVVHGPATIRARADAPFADRATLTLMAALLNSDVDVQRRGPARRTISGSSTEEALVRAAWDAGLDARRLKREFPTVALTERAPGVHYVVSVHRTSAGRHVAFVKGAPEQLAEICDVAGIDIAGRNRALADAGLRVLAVGWRPLDGPEPPRDGFIYLGMIGLRDPLRAGAADAIAAAREAGIRTVMLTGDQRRTAEAIARQLGLDGEAIDGSELSWLVREASPEARARLRRLAVVARVSPTDKLAVVEALRRAGEIVAMAGDGINDGPALKVADVAIAVGHNATDLARHVADVVLQGDDLRSILAAVAEGRIVQDNLRRAVRFLFATNFSELALVVAAALVGAREPLTPLQLLWINLLTDTVPALALALEPGDRSVLGRPPAPPSAPILSARMRRQVARDGGLIALAAGAATIAGGRPFGFGVLLGAQLAYTVQCRARERPASPRFDALVGGTVAVQAMMLMLEPLRRLLSLGVGATPVAGFALGFVLPSMMARFDGGGQIVRRGLHRAARNPRTST
jgi:Ca2+-transporting ATPase